MAKVRYQLKPGDVAITGGGGCISGRGRAALSRKLDLTTFHYVLEHRPTGIQVRGHVLQGHYTRREMSVLKRQLLERLWGELENKAMAALRVPGR